MSERGVNSLRQANRPLLLERILERTIPMHSRMVHGMKNGTVTQQSQKYDPHGRVRPWASLQGHIFLTDQL